MNVCIVCCIAVYVVSVYMDGYVWHKDRNHMKSPTHIAALSNRFLLIKPRCKILYCSGLNIVNNCKIVIFYSTAQSVEVGPGQCTD